MEKPLNPHFVALLEYVLDCATKGIPREKVLTNDNPKFINLFSKACHSIGATNLTDEFMIELDRTDKAINVTPIIRFITGYDGPEYTGPRYQTK